METSGLDPELTICKIAVLPVKLCPLSLIYLFFYKTLTYITFLFTDQLSMQDTSYMSSSKPFLICLAKKNLAKYFSTPLILYYHV